MTTTRQANSKLGGLATLKRYGPGYMSAIGKLGGRPRLETLTERHSTTPNGLNNNLRRNRLARASLRELKELWRQRSSPVV